MIRYRHPEGDAHEGTAPTWVENPLRVVHPRGVILKPLLCVSYLFHMAKSMTIPPRSGRAGYLVPRPATVQIRRPLAGLKPFVFNSNVPRGRTSSGPLPGDFPLFDARFTACRARLLQGPAPGCGSPMTQRIRRRVIRATGFCQPCTTGFGSPPPWMPPWELMTSVLGLLTCPPATGLGTRLSSHSSWYGKPRGLSKRPALDRAGSSNGEFESCQLRPATLQFLAQSSLQS
jgi:hypothetical protein